MTDINTTYDVYVLGDADTCQRTELLSEKAAEHGAVIARTFAFAPGEAAEHEDLTEVDAVVEAVARAIATRTDVWLPFWLQDLCREAHLRRLSLILQRHGLNLLLGPHLEPCPSEGGLNQIDAAIREEVRATYALDDAVMARVGMSSLGAEIEAALANGGQSARSWEPLAEPPFDETEYEDVHFDTGEVAALLGKSPDWVSRRLRAKAFLYADGSAVMPLRGVRGARRRFTVPMVRAIVWSAYRAGALSPQQLEEVLAELARSER